MRLLYHWMRIQLRNCFRIFRVVSFDKKAISRSYSFGFLWEFLSPALQILIYYFIFGVRLKGRVVVNSEMPYINWMLSGIIPWFYISSSIVAGAGSICQNLNLISKTKFPIEILPTISVLKGLNSFFTMMGIFIIYFMSQGFFPTIEWTQLIYFFCCMVFVLVSVSVFTSAITVIFRDFQLILNSSMRLLFFVSGAVIDISNNSSSIFGKILMLNPFVYVIEGFRDAILSRRWFFQDIDKMLYFFSSVTLILIIGIYICEKYKEDFVEFM